MNIIQMKNKALLLIAFLIVAAENSFAYTINYGGTSYSGSYDVLNSPSFAGSGMVATGPHDWNAVNDLYDPQSGVTYNGDGNEYSPFQSGVFTIEPETGDATSGSVNVLLGCSYSVVYNVVLDNFTAPPFAATYAALVGIGQPVEDSPVGLSVASFSVFSDSTFSVELNIGQAYYIYANLDDGDVSGQVGFGSQPGTWTPTVIDPTQAGSATVTTSATFNDFSIQVIPEPGSFVLLTLGLPLVVLTISRGKYMARRIHEPKTDTLS
jgi:hypothetical protein